MKIYSQYINPYMEKILNNEIDLMYLKDTKS